ncbi:MAG: type II toxin-antitoxin system RelE/ParE family toxin [Amaricoccus sp.]|uniref:type II toxin-antitoxin system RelE/ParE family toxin n=1 Tax=Amaricoccus sp. TaxID=1872485 RepID=UPI0033160108
MIRPILRPRAVRDIGQIWDYTAAQWGVAQAERYVRALRDVCALLASGALSGTDASEILPGYRRIRSGRHVIFFRQLPDGGVEIVRVLHQRMDARDHLD